MSHGPACAAERCPVGGAVTAYGADGVAEGRAVIDGHEHFHFVLRPGVYVLRGERGCSPVRVVVKSRRHTSASVVCSLL